MGRDLHFVNSYGLNVFEDSVHHSEVDGGDQPHEGEEVVGVEEAVEQEGGTCD